jgi:hypothetical protein
LLLGTLSDPDILQKRNAHRHEQALIEGDLIDRIWNHIILIILTLQNAPILGVDSEGRRKRANSRNKIISYYYSFFNTFALSFLQLIYDLIMPPALLYPGKRTTSRNYITQLLP